VSLKILLPKVLLPSFTSADLVAREAALAAAKKDGQNKNVGAAARMTLQERLAASIAKSRTGSPKTGETGTSTLEEGGEGNSNGVLKISMPSSPVRTETPGLPVSPTKIEVSSVEAAEDVPSRTETPDISVIPPADSIPPLRPTPSPPPAEQPQESLPTDSQPLEAVTPVEPPLQIPSPPRTSTASLPPDTDPATSDLITQLRNDLSTCEARRVEESQTASTRISTLEQKLKLLSQTTHEHSKDLAANPTASSWERKLADREDKIALLLDEGPLPKPVLEEAVS
jgi:TATA element modulatory factor